MLRIRHLFFGIGMAVTLATVGLLARGLILRLEQVALRRGLFGQAIRTVTAYSAALAVCGIGVVLAVRSVLQLG